LSAIAELHIIPFSLLTELDAAATPSEYVATLTTKRRGFLQYSYSGWVLATLLPVLQTEYQIDPMGSEKERSRAYSLKMGDTQFIFTASERDMYVDRLAPSSFAPGDLRKNFEEFNATEVPGVEEPMQNGIRFLRAGLEQMGVHEVVLLTIG